MRHQEGRKEMFYLTTHSTHFIYCQAQEFLILKGQSNYNFEEKENITQSRRKEEHVYSTTH